MTPAIFSILDSRHYLRAGPMDLMELAAPPGVHPIFVRKWIVEALVLSIARGELVHLSGPTGSAKSSLVEALAREPQNAKVVCAALGLPVRPIALFPVEMVTYETPGELYQRRALLDGATFDEPSSLVRALAEASRAASESYPLVWLRELGRVTSPAVQGGLLNLMVRGDVLLPDGSVIDARRIAWLADSNYQAERDATHTLVTFDDALKRRFSVNLTLDYLPPEQEATVVARLSGTPTEDPLIQGVVKLGQVIRRERGDGGLLSAIPPTIYGYLAFVRTARALPHLPPAQVAALTLLGNVSSEDERLVPAVVNEAFGLENTGDETAPLPVTLF